MDNTGRPGETPAEANSGKRALLFRVAALALGLVLSFLCLELLVRITLAARPNDIEALRRFEHVKRTGGELKMIHFVRLSPNPRIVYEMLPNIEGTFHGATLRTNSAGFADKERQPVKSKGTYRIAVIGDSIAFGWGVNPDDRYSNLLEDFLNETSTSGVIFEVLNFGVPGYNTVMETELLKEKVLAYQPDALILGYCADNDTSLPNFISKPRPLYTVTHSYLWDILKSRSFGPVRLALEGAVEYSDPSIIPEEYRALVGWDNAKRALEEMAEIARKRSMPIAFLRDYYFLEPYREKGTSEPLDIGREATEFAAKCGFIVVNPLAEMIRWLDKYHMHSFALSVDPEKGDAHPNPFRHAILAKSLYLALVENKALPDWSTRRMRLLDDTKRWDDKIAVAASKSKIAEKYRNNTTETTRTLTH